MERKLQNGKKPKQLINIKASKYETSEAIHNNKKYWRKVFKKLDGVNKNPVEGCEAHILSDALPLDLCKKVCNILDIDMPSKKPNTADKTADKNHRRSIKEPMFSQRQILYFDREMDSDTDVEVISSEEEDKPNIHREFLKKPIREQITWPTHYLEPEREDEKSLVKRADDLTDKIAQDFSDYIKQLGGDQQSQLFSPKSIKELFQIEFDTHVARSLQVLPKELPTVEEKVAIATGNIEKSRFAALEREISNKSKDILAEKRPDNLIAFQRRLPKQDQYRNPRNDTKNLWRSARHVPKDLVTLKTVWEGITNLRSVKEYCRWMIEHPEHRRAPYLNSLGMFDSAVLESRLTFEIQQELTPNVGDPTDIPAPIDHIRKRLSELADGV